MGHAGIPSVQVEQPTIRGHTTTMVGHLGLGVLILISAGSVTPFPAPVEPDLILVRMDGEPSPILVAAMDMMQERKKEEDNRSVEVGPGNTRKHVEIEKRNDDKPVEISDDNKGRPFQRPIPRVPSPPLKRNHRIRGRVRRRRKYQHEEKKEDESTNVGTVRPSRLRVSRNMNLRTRRKIKSRDRGKNNIRQRNNIKETTTNYIREPTTMSSVETTTMTLGETATISSIFSEEISKMLSKDEAKNLAAVTELTGSEASKEIEVELAEETEIEAVSQDITTRVPDTTEPDNDTKRVQSGEINIVTDNTNHQEVSEANTEITFQEETASLNC